MSDMNQVEPQGHIKRQNSRSYEKKKNIQWLDNDDDDDDENDNDDDDDDSYMGCVVVHVDIIVNLSNFNTASNSDPIATIQIVGVCKSKEIRQYKKDTLH